MFTVINRILRLSGDNRFITYKTFLRLLKDFQQKFKGQVKALEGKKKSQLRILHLAKYPAKVRN